ncbi:spore coat U domain-containing protein [Aphanizomenon sp. CS-733/32]|uniref:Csu type fimbrial protein n=1 Tax=Aphanizomenon sp. CS-733/32 TaxID=3021715 RepID=UPI00232A8404|nr:spore coat U domain-containing protein [Aphanizomenon sp. CS-733/32]MDB9308651.1 spore coat U domain-containing protein [Aphanizomenon sp. CS-733/32]
MIRRFALASAILIAASSAVSVVSAAPAMAGTATSDLTVSSNVVNNCTISTSSINFGNYDPISDNASSDLIGTGSVTVTCTSGASATITLDAGANPANGSTNALPLRRLSNGTTGYLNYYVVFQSGISVAYWGNTADTGVSHTGTGSASELNPIGTIPSGQNVPAGSYADTVVATVTF